jgi:ribonucrease Y
MLTTYLGCAIASVVIVALGYLLIVKPAAQKAKQQLEEALKLKEQADREIQTRQKEILLEAKDEAHRIRAEVERENREKRADIQRLERRLTQKEEVLDRRLENLDRKERALTAK